MKDRILSPNYYQYDDKKLRARLTKLGLRKTYRIKKKVKGKWKLKHTVNKDGIDDK